MPASPMWELLTIEGRHRALEMWLAEKEEVDFTFYLILINLHLNLNSHV